MSDATIQGYIQALIQADDNFSDGDVTLGDYLVLDSGSPPYAVILPGRIVSAERSGDWSQINYVWEHSVEIFERFIDDSYADFSTARQAVADAIGESPTLGGNSEITNAYVIEATAPQYLYSDEAREVPVFVFSRLRVRSTEAVLYDGGGEFA